MISPSERGDDLSIYNEQLVIHESLRLFEMSYEALWLLAVITAVASVCSSLLMEDLVNDSALHVNLPNKH